MGSANEPRGILPFARFRPRDRLAQVIEIGVVACFMAQFVFSTSGHGAPFLLGFPVVAGVFFLVAFEQGFRSAQKPTNRLQTARWFSVVFLSVGVLVAVGRVLLRKTETLVIDTVLVSVATFALGMLLGRRYQLHSLSLGRGSVPVALNLLLVGAASGVVWWLAGRRVATLGVLVLALGFIATFFGVWIILSRVQVLRARRSKGSSPEVGLGGL